MQPFRSRPDVRTSQLIPQNLINFLARGKPSVFFTTIPTKRHFWAHRQPFATNMLSDANISSQNFLHIHALIPNKRFYTSFAQTLQSLRHESTQIFHILIATGQNTIVFSQKQVTVFRSQPCPDFSSSQWCTLQNGCNICRGS